MAGSRNDLAGGEGVAAGGCMLARICQTLTSRFSC
jgi:hypothetical protein